MGFAHVASTVKGTASGGGATNAIDTTGADLLVAVVAWFNGAGTAPSVTDSKGNTWTGLTARATNSNRVRLYYCKPASVGSGHTLSANLTSSFDGLWFGAFSGSRAIPFGNENGATSGVSAVSSIQPGSVTPDQDGCLLVTGMVAAGTSSGYAAGGYTSLAASFTSGQYVGIGGAYLIQSTAGASNPTWSWTGATGAATAIAWFKPAEAGVAVPSLAMNYYRRRR